MSAAASSSGTDNVQQRLHQLFAQYPHTFLLVQQSCDHRIMFYVADIAESGKELRKIDAYVVDLQQHPLQPQPLKGNMLYTLALEIAPVAGKAGRYLLTMPILKQKPIEAIMVGGKLHVKVDIGQHKRCDIIKVLVHMDIEKVLGREVPKIHHIKLLGTNQQKQQVDEQFQAPGMREVSDIIQQQKHRLGVVAD